MDTLVLTNMVFDALGLVAVVVGLALASCLPGRHRPRPWVSPENVEPKHAA